MNIIKINRYSVIYSMVICTSYLERHIPVFSIASKNAVYDFARRVARGIFRHIVEL